MIFQSVKYTAVEIVKQKIPNSGLTHKNIMLSAIHTHSGPGATSWHNLYNFTTYGFYKDALDATAQGIADSIIDAYNSMIDNVTIEYTNGSLPDVHISRSPQSYMLDPEVERDEYDDNQDNNFYLFKFTDSNNKPLGVITFYAIHAHSIENTNHLVNSDNKGYAS